MSAGLEPREAMEFDVLVVGAGPAGLAAAIRLKQLNPEISVCVVEKGSEVGAHILSGAVLEPRALRELFPDCDPSLIPLATPVTDDRFMFLTANKAFKLPTPPQMHNAGNYIVSLGNVVRWLGQQAEEAGVEIYPGFAAAELLLEDGRVAGVATGDMGIGKDGQPTGNHQRGMELRATYTIFAEGCRGSLAKQLMQAFDLNARNDPQTYALGVKELWEIQPDQFRRGLAMHSIGWPLSSDVYGGSFMYHFGDNLLAYGFVVGLDYANPFLSPFDEMQRYKTHPSIAPVFAGAKRISYGSRALNEGGLQSLPKMTFPGGVLVGCAAGTLNVPKIKGTHTGMKSGMVAAEALAAALAGSRPPEVTAYADMLRASWVWPELHQVRNIRPGFAKLGLYGGLANAALETYVLRGKAPWTLQQPQRLRPAYQGQGRHADPLPEAGRHAHLRPAVLGVPLQHQP